MDSLIIPFMIVLLAIAFIIVIRVIASRYKKIPPNAVGIFYGRKYVYRDPSTGAAQTLGFKVVGGGGRIILPFVESYQEMSTAAFQTEIDEQGIPNKDNVKVNVRGVATGKISSIQEDLVNAAQAFLGKSSEEIKAFDQNILKGHLRSIIGKMQIDTLLRERDQFNKQVVDESSEELKRLGIQIITLVIQEVSDEYGYIPSSPHTVKRTAWRCFRQSWPRRAAGTRPLSIPAARLAEQFSLRMPVSRILVNMPETEGCIGLGNGLTPSLTLGCGTYGRNSITDNVTYTHLLNIKRMALSLG